MSKVCYFLTDLDDSLTIVIGPQWLIGLAGLESNHRLSPLWVCSSPTSGNAEDLSQYDPSC